MSGQMPGTTGQPQERSGWSTCGIVALVIVALILLVFGVCVAVLSSGGV
jgi:hypothetical protein